MSGGQAGLLAFAKEARIGAPFGKVVCEQGVAQGHAVALRADVEAVFVYSAAARFHTSSSVPGSSPKAVAIVVNPTGPPLNLSMIVVSNLLSI